MKKENKKSTEGMIERKKETNIPRKGVKEREAKSMREREK